MPNIKIISIILIVVGAGLLIWGYQLSGSFGSEMSKAFSGSAPEGVMWRYIAGAASLIAGAYLFFKKA